MDKRNAILFCIGFTLLYFGLQAASGAVVGFINYLAGTEKALIGRAILDQIFIIQILGVLFFIAVVMLFRKFRKSKIWEPEKNNTPLKLQIVSIVLSFSYSLIWSLLNSSNHFENAGLIESSRAYFSEISPWFGPALMFLSVMLAAPFGEEFLYRRMMISRLQRSYSSHAAILVSSIIFGVTHIFAGGTLLAIGAFLMGAILGCIYVGTGNNFKVVVASHMAANGADFILPMIPENTHFVLIATLCAASGICIHYLYRNVHRPRPD